MSNEITRTAMPLLDGGPEEACLVLIYGGSELGKRYALDQELSIGRDAGNTIVLELSDVSRQHARLVPHESGWSVRDLGSTNGTQVNGVDARGEIQLRNGDLVRTGGAIFKYISGSNVESLFHEEIYRLTIFDGLTGTANRRCFNEFLEREFARSQRYGSPLSLALFDIDHFKKINDTWGHPAGDAVLQRVAQTVAKNVRREQLFARIGGEEFALVLPELEGAPVLEFCEKARLLVEAERVEFQGEQLRATISIGCASMAGRASREALVSAADHALYTAKSNGRNRVVSAEHASEATPPPNVRQPGA